MKYEDKIMEIVINTINLAEPKENIKIDTNLSDVGMDSISFVALVVEIENFFCIDFPDEKLTITEAGTIKSLCEIVSAIKGGKV